MATLLITALNGRSVCAYEREDDQALPGLRSVGAVLALHGIADIGGLPGGAIENLFSNDNLEAVDDAVAGLRWLDLPDVAAVNSRAREEYLRFRPTGCEELSADDAALWGQRDAAYFMSAPVARLEEAARSRLQDIAPELLPP